MIRVLFVCMGNICRSPTAEAVFRRQVQEAGLDAHIHVDSAGTHDYHIGDEPDARTWLAAGRRGYDMTGLKGRQVGPGDFEVFHYVLAMDTYNLKLLKRLCPPEHGHKLELFMAYSARFEASEVPDPYYGGDEGFEQVLDMVEDAARGLLAHIRATQFKVV